MANISQNVNIEMLEKLPDGTYKRKYPKTRSDTGVTFDEHLADDVTQAHLAKNIGLEDTTGNFVATDVEGAMNELFTNVSNGKSLVGRAITDVDDSVVIPTDPTFNDLANAIGQISTGKKWASGTAPLQPRTNETGGGEGQYDEDSYYQSNPDFFEASNLDFTPSFVVGRYSNGAIVCYVGPGKILKYEDARGIGFIFSSRKPVVMEFDISRGDYGVYEGGFKLGVGNIYASSNITVEWIAYE